MNTTLTIVSTSDGKPALDSNEVSLLFEIPHNALYTRISELRRELEALEINPRLYFRMQTDADENGTLESYRITWEGFYLLATSLPGDKGLAMRVECAASMIELLKIKATKEGKPE